MNGIDLLCGSGVLVAAALVFGYERRRRARRVYIARILEKGADGTERPVVIGGACSSKADAEDSAWERYERLCGVAVTETGHRLRPDRNARCVVREVT